MAVDTKKEIKAILDEYLDARGHRRTRERYEILETVYEMNGHFTLQDLGRKMEEKRFPVSKATLYNTMNLFMELRLVIRHRFQGTTMYEARLKNENHCHQVCTVCGKVTELNLPEIVHAIDNTHLKRFHKDGFSLYVYGICSTCQSHITRRRNAMLKTEKQKQNKK